MQEMDGLTSAGSNREARVSVVAATNRPFVSASNTLAYQAVLIRIILLRTWMKPFFDVCLEGKQKGDIGSVKICPDVFPPRNQTLDRSSDAEGPRR